MLLILQRLLLSVTTIFLFQEPTILIYFTLAVHSIFFFFNLFVRPYRNLGVDGIAFGINLSNTLIVAYCYQEWEAVW